MTESPQSPLILVVEDESSIRAFLRASLSAAGFRVHEATTGEAAIRLSEREPPDLVILDLGLPDFDGHEVLRRLSGRSRVPIIVSSARNNPAEKVATLEAGAVDYLTKPFSISDLLVRVRAVLRHAPRELGAERTAIESGDLRVDLVAGQVFCADAEVRLSQLELELLTVFVRNAGKLLPTSFLLESVWGETQPEAHHLRVLIANLRRKIERDAANPTHLLSEQGVAYRFVVD